MRTSIGRRGRAVVLAAVLGMSAQAHAQLVTANWLPSTNGSWTVASNWSTNPNFPRNGTPTGVTYDALIAAAGTYTVSYGSSSTLTLHGLTVNNAGTTLALTSGGLNVSNGVNLPAGQLSLSGASINNTAITGPGTMLVLGSASWSNATLANTTATIQTAPFTFNNTTIQVSSGFSLNNGTIVINDLNQGVTTGMNLNASASLGGTGQVLFDGLASSLSKNFLTLGNGSQIPAGWAIRTRTGSATIGASGAAFTNAGTISAETSGRQLDVWNVTNSGTISVSNGSTLNMRGSYARGASSAIAINNGTLNIGGTDLLYNPGTFSRTGGTVTYLGTSNNTGKTLDLSNTAMGAVTLGAGASVTGGTLTATAGTYLGPTTGGNAITFSGVTLDGDFNVAAGTNLTTIGTTLTLAPLRTLTLNGSSSAPVSLTAASLVGGTIVFDGDASSSGADVITTSTISAGTTIRTGTRGGTIARITSGPILTNAGTLIAQTPGKTLQIGSFSNSNWTNTGTIRADAGTLRLQGIVTTAGMGTIIRSPAATLEVIGTIDNTNATLNLNQLGPVVLAGGDIVGGVVEGSATNNLTVSDFTVLDRTTLRNLTVVVPAGVGDFDAVGSLTLDNTTIRMSGYSFPSTSIPVSVLSIGDPSSGVGNACHLLGTGTILADNDANVVSVSGGSSGGGTIAAGITIKTVIGAGDTRGGIAVGAAGVTSYGLISSEVAPDAALEASNYRYEGGLIEITGGETRPVVNEGTMRALNGGELIISHLVNNASVTADGGKLSIRGLHSNAGTIATNNTVVFLDDFAPANVGNFTHIGGTLIFGDVDNANNVLASADYGPLILEGTITGGRVVASPGVPLNVGGGGATFANTTLAGTIGSSDSQITFRSFTLDGATIELTSSLVDSTWFYASSSGLSNEVLAGTGTLVFTGATDFSAIAPALNTSRTLTLGPGITVKTGTVGGIVGDWDSRTSNTMVNQGTILADAAGKTLTLFSRNFTNQGTLEARNGGIIKQNSWTTLTNVSGNMLTGGKYVVKSDSKIELNAGTSITTLGADVVLEGAGSTFAAIAPIASISSLGSFEIDRGRNFTTLGSLSNAGTLRVGKDSTLTINGSLTNSGKIKGKGTIVAANVISSGTIAPGDSPGALSILGNLAMTSSGATEIEVGGTTAGVDYDVLDVGGALTLDGTLQITFINGFQPDADDVFDFFNFGSVSGQFDAVMLPPLPAGVVWDTSSLQSGGPTSVPEPAGFVAVGAVAMLLRRRKRITRVIAVTD